jgi:hypothetical protein
MNRVSRPSFGEIVDLIESFYYKYCSREGEGTNLEIIFTMASDVSFFSSERTRHERRDINNNLLQDCAPSQPQRE